MAERDAAIGMLAGLLGEQRTVGADKTNQRYFVRLRLFHPKNFFTMRLLRLKEPMISTKLLGFDCGQLTRVRCRELSDGTQTILMRHLDHDRRATWDAVHESTLSRIAKGMP
jgi:hypothetical protein